MGTTQASMKKTIVFLAPGMPFNGQTYKERGLGGSETAVLFMARSLARMGHNVYVFSNIEEQASYDGVRYVPLSQWEQFALTTPHDVLIGERLPEFFKSPTQAKLNILHLHDLQAKENQNSAKGVMWNVDRILTVSEFHRQQALEALDVDEEYVYATRNGISLDLFPRAQPERDRHKLVYSARPERGLDVLLSEVFPRILEKDPEAHLVVTGYGNPVDHFQDLYRQIENKAAEFGDKITWKLDLPKESLYREYATAGCYVYPTPSPVMPEFREVSCITAMECMAAGLPMVTSDGGAMPETLDERAGTMLSANPWDDPQAYADAVIDYIQDDEKFGAASEAGREVAQSLDWQDVAQEWDKLFDRLIEERNDSPERLARHFVKRSDVEPAKELNRRYELGLDLSDWEYEIGEHYEGVEEEEAYEAGQQEKRLQIVKQIIENNLTEGKLLDFGCGQGIYAIELANYLPNLQVDGVDISPRQIDYARSHSDKYADGSNVAFWQGDEDSLPSKEYDGVFLGEFLEHQYEPWKALKKAEGAVKPGGLVVFTVPYGPWEFGEGENHHLWELDPHCIDEMVGHKPNLGIAYQHEGAQQVTGDPVGWHLVFYQADHKPIGPIDMERKLKLQNPRQTVAGCIMAGPGSEKSLRLHLDSYAHFLDQLVVADTGLSDEARSIFEEYGAEFVKAPNPTEVGFEIPRNMALEQCEMDWVVWIDTDEHFVEPEKFLKYLRENCYHGYGIYQHHFAVDTDFNPDMPVRLFRRRPTKDGKQIRWYGMIHEHPELELNEGPGHVVILSDVNIAHYGYLIESGRQNRFWRNYPLLKKDIEVYPERLLQKHFICRDSVLLAGYILEQNGGVITEQVQNLLEDAISTYQHFFLGKPGFVNVDTDQYYDRALRILGKGIEANVQIQPGEGRRFASMEDLRAEVGAKLEQMEEA